MRAPTCILNELLFVVVMKIKVWCTGATLRFNIFYKRRISELVIMELPVDLKGVQLARHYLYLTMFSGVIEIQINFSASIKRGCNKCHQKW